jgi:hypothetical protein
MVDAPRKRTRRCHPGSPTASPGSMNTMQIQQNTMIADISRTVFMDPGSSLRFGRDDIVSWASDEQRYI